MRILQSQPRRHRTGIAAAEDDPRSILLRREREREREREKKNVRIIKGDKRREKH